MSKHQLKDSQYTLSRAEIRRIVRAAETFRNRCIIECLADTGIRRFELRDLHVTDIDFEQKEIKIIKGKGGKERIAPASDDLLADLKLLIRDWKRGPVFSGPRRKPLSLRMINNVVAKAGHDAGVENPNPNYDNITCHLFRHSFAHEYKRHARTIADLEALASILGHASVKTTLDEYGTPTLRDMHASYDRVMRESEEGN